MSKTRVLIGTCSWTDPTLIESGWYPARLKDDADKRLRYYAERFPIVENDAAFYALPSQKQALLWAEREDDADDLRALGKPLRQRVLHESLLRVELAGASGDARALAEDLARALELGSLELQREVKPRFACRCSRDRVVRALATLARDELRDMAARDNGAEASCDFCGARYGISAAELLQLAGDGPLPA